MWRSELHTKKLKQLILQSYRGGPLPNIYDQMRSEKNNGHLVSYFTEKYGASAADLKKIGFSLEEISTVYRNPLSLLHAGFNIEEMLSVDEPMTLKFQSKQLLFHTPFYLGKRHNNNSASSVYKFWTDTLNSMLPMISCHMCNPIFHLGYDPTGILLDMDKPDILVHMMSSNTLMFPNPGSTKNSDDWDFNNSSLRPNGQNMELAKKIIQPYFSREHCFFHKVYEGPKDKTIEESPSRYAEQLCATTCYDNECIVSTSLDAMEGIISLQWPPDRNAIDLSLFSLKKVRLFFSDASPM